MKNNSIKVGKIIEISNTQINISIDNNLQAAYKVIDGYPIRIGGVGNFVRVGSNIYEVINEKITLDKKEKVALKRVVDDKILICNIVGYFQDKVFQQGSNGDTPNIFDDVYTVNHNELESIYLGVQCSNTISIGKFLNRQELNFSLDLNKFFASHILIVGNTGSGKSNTINTIFSELFNKRNTKSSLFLVIDTNGEYKDSFTDNKEYKRLTTKKGDENQVKIPLEVLENEDWKLLLEATDKTQFPIIKKSWKAVQREIFQKDINNITKFIVDNIKRTLKAIICSNNVASTKLSSVYSLIDDISYSSGYSSLYKELGDEVIKVFEKYEANNRNIINRSISLYDDRRNDILSEINNLECTSNKNDFNVYDFGFVLNLEHIFRVYKYGITENNTSPLIARFNSSKHQFNRIFTEYRGDDSKTIISNLFDKSNILVCDVSGANKDIRRIIVTFLCSKLYSLFYERKADYQSLHLIVDEAHNYLSNQRIDKEDAIAKSCIETFESIIKEGRKFGVFLTMASQRPSDISNTLLSQAHNYIVHKLVNPYDIDIIKHTAPFIDEMSMRMLTILNSGQAIFSGVAFNRPSVVKVNYLNQSSIVNSKTVKLSGIWGNNDIELKEIDEGITNYNK